jgi:predicted RNA binding protein YcfA (HicA-like mRNA interferase family)
MDGKSYIARDLPTTGLFDRIYISRQYPIFKKRIVVDRREKLLKKMRNSPTGVRFAEVVALLHIEGFVLFNRRGSHCTFHRADGRLLTIVRPHGSRTTCHPADIRKLLEAIER